MSLFAKRNPSRAFGVSVAVGMATMMKRNMLTGVCPIPHATFPDRNTRRSRVSEESAFREDV